MIGPPRPRGRIASRHCERCGGPRPPQRQGKWKLRGKLCAECRLLWEQNCVECGVRFEYRAEAPSRRFCDDCVPETTTDRYNSWKRRNPQKAYEAQHRSLDRRRARLAEVKYEQFWRKTIYKRDGWKCGICDGGVDPDLSWPHPRSASLDHIVPLSQGGEHIRTNVRLTHLHCNTSRGVGNYDDPIQLVLV